MYNSNIDSQLVTKVFEKLSVQNAKSSNFLLSLYY